MAVPIQRMKSVQGVLLLSTRPGEIDDVLIQERQLILSVSLLALLAMLAASLLLARTIADPMRRLSEAARHVSGNIRARAELPVFPNRSDEVAQLASAFRAMTSALYRRIEASEKFAADVAHELKNPLTAARSTAEALAYAKSESSRAELVQQIQNELKRLNRLITDVSNASRLDAELALQQTERVDLRLLLAGVIDVFRDMLDGCKRRINLDIPPRPADAFVVRGHEGRLGQVLTNLLDNAISFSPECGSIRVTARRDGPEIEILVEDEGPGIPEDKLEQIFERFYSDRPATDAKRGKNSGLGLSISREIVRAHEGRIWAENRQLAVEGPGARFVVRLPAADPTSYRGIARLGRRP
jgi:two-component system sensor histidine kinase ChvG